MSKKPSLVGLALLLAISSLCAEDSGRKDLASQVLYSSDFSDPKADGWQFSSAWTVGKDGLLTPVGVGDFSQRAWMPDRAYTSELRTLRFRFTPQSSGVRFAMGTARSVTSFGKSSLCQVDDENHLLKIHYRNDQENKMWDFEPKVITSAPLPPLSPGTEYEVELSRNKRIITATVFEAKSRKVLVTVSDGSNDTSSNNLTSGEMNETPILINRSGQTLFHEVVMEAPVAKSPKVFIMGDSITNGYGIHLGQRWADKVRDAVGGRAMLAGEDGASSALIPGLLAGELSAVQPEWVICNLGTNGRDGGLAKYQEHINSLIKYCKDNDIRLALAVFPSTQGRQNAALRDWLKTLKDVHLIRFDRALSIDNDGETIDYEKLYIGVGAHPNEVGNEVMYQQVRKDVPELFQ